MSYKVNCACYNGQNKIIHATLLAGLDKIMISGVAFIKDDFAEVELYKKCGCTTYMRDTIQTVLTEMLNGMDIRKIKMVEV